MGAEGDCASDPIGIYEVDECYIDYLIPFAPHLFWNSRPGQANARKYIGVVLSVNDMELFFAHMEYFAPLSSFKDKHRRMKEGLDLIKVKDYAVINLNCMFPVPSSQCKRVDIAAVVDARYRSLLLAEYRVIKGLREKIRKNARNLYRHKLDHGDATGLAARCNDFEALEQACKQFQS